MARCDGCGANIDWVETENKKRMPLDPGAIAIVTDCTEDESTETIVTTQGQTLRGRIAIATDANVVRGRRSHFATCPMANDFRRAR